MERPDIKGLLVKAANGALTIQRPLVRAHVRRIRRLRPNASPAELVKALEKHYLATVATLGAAS